ncbi:hypothetical protein LQ327_24010 [Actinomycetospora endophytica]|uniref:Uncharacterized protein n=1 Tax=Actinomycetospora endophytica TaxID=2291215 RepID=A0ABS8PG07_9PSEU|nr:hypothetical protein [Actinomycetospora endophytica]MCD2196445.1 hypothetical protein [Actinomycetospora endophytica]
MDPEARPEDEGPDDDVPRWPRYAIGLAVLLVVVLVTAWAAGLQLSGPSPDGGSTDAVRLGPASGEDVGAYLARTAVVPAPTDPSPRLALVQFDAALTPDAAAAALARTTPLQAVVRVPFPRVQTALHRVDTPPAAPAAALQAALTTAGGEAAADAARAGPATSPADTRRVAVAEAEATALGRPGCACLIAAVVRVAPDAVADVRRAPGVRAVEVAPPGASRTRLAVSPLLPDQGPGRPDGPVVGPVPDDGPVPAG